MPSAFRVVGVELFLLLGCLLLLPPFIAAVPAVPSALLLPSVWWFAPNLTVVSSNATSAPLVSWPTTANAFTLLPDRSLNTTAAPSVDRTLSPPSVSFNSSSRLSVPVDCASFFPSTLLLLVNVAQNCSWPACALLSTAGKNRTASLILSTSPSPTFSLYFLQVTLVTALSSWTAQSSIPLPFNTWQAIALTTTSLSNSSLITLRTPAGSEQFLVLLPVNDSLAYDPTIRCNLTLGDSAFRGSFRDVAVVPSPASAWSDDGDAAFAFFYGLYGLVFPPARMAAPSVSLLNGTALLVQWVPPYSPTSAVLSYQLRVVATTPSALSTSSFIPTYNTLTAYQFSPVRRRQHHLLLRRLRFQL